MDENIALIRFERGWEADGSDPETGLPRYREVVEIIKSIPPLTEVRYAATDADFHHPDPRIATPSSVSSASRRASPRARTTASRWSCGR